MSFCGRGLAALLGALALLAAVAPGAGAAPGAPRGLMVEGGESAWHPVRQFLLSWSSPGTGDGKILTARYELRDDSGRLAVPEKRVPTSTRSMTVIVPGRPGEYTLRLRFEDDEGDVGPAATARLRYDDAAPPVMRPVPPDRWLGRHDFPLAVPLDRDEGPLPVSGLAGYAISLGSPPDEPCAAADLCRPTEINPPDGHGHRLVFTSLPEGTSKLGVLGVSGAGVPSELLGEARLRVDKTYPATRLSGLPSDWSNRPVRLTATAADGRSGMSASSGARTAIRIGNLPPAVAAGNSVSATVFGEGRHRVSYYARDAAGNVDDGDEGHGRPNRPPRTATVRIDRTPPRAAFAAPRPDDPELLIARVGDELSGPDTPRSWIGIRPAGGRGRFEPLPPAPAPNGQVRARWDSDSYPEGDYEFALTAYDAAGNRARSGRRGSGSGMVLTNPVKATTELRAGFGGRVMTWHRCVRRRGKRHCRRQTIVALARRPARRTVPYGRGMRLSGRLLAGTLGRAPGAPVRIVERFGPGAATRVRSRLVRTDAHGRFRARLRPGPSRTIVARFAGTRRLVRSHGRRLRLNVRTGVRMRASGGVARIGGAPLRLRGRVAAGPEEIPAEGLPVQLQFRLPGLPWEEFRTVRTDRRGRFDYAYRFSDDDSRGARFFFRAFVPKQSDWPYAPGGSRPVAVIGV